MRKWKGSTVAPDPNAAPKLSPYAQLREAHVQLIEKHHHLEREIEAGGGGDLWTLRDTADDIANVMVRELPTNKAERVARAMLGEAEGAKDQRRNCEV